MILCAVIYHQILVFVQTLLWVPFLKSVYQDILFVMPNVVLPLLYFHFAFYISQFILQQGSYIVYNFHLQTNTLILWQYNLYTTFTFQIHISIYEY